MQQLELTGGEVGDPGVLDLACLFQGDKGVGHLVGIHQGIRAVDQQQIQVVGAEFFAGMPQRWR